MEICDREQYKNKGSSFNVTKCGTYTIIVLMFLGISPRSLLTLTHLMSQTKKIKQVPDMRIICDSSQPIGLTGA